ncbi:sensor histidine kinase [Candidatus Enterococcus ferrettii]|uniref:histidine kinase n=1 Tax=Candidatus Enterococcus ferrettii TaxID=2815324 RepID=A0ABV0EVE9_9ENTE|nr:HAMP domain-containing sensor histidine kinase [Enterococcus sp. 665A]MBO1338643.1 HAMP domain-containing histidine kinase [Enterococcus sp. 665A]
MLKKLHSSLWVYFTCMIFLIMVLLLGFFVTSMFVLNRFDILSTRQEQHIFPLAIISLLSLLIGLGVSAIVSKRILHPIASLRQAMTQVAKGDLTVQLTEDQKVEDVEQLYHDFNVMVKELSSIETLRNDFVSTVSHEFKTPVATIRGYVQLLQNEQLKPEQRRIYLERMLDGTLQLSQLTDNVLHLTKLESQSIQFPKESFQLDEQIREVILFLQPKWETQQLQLDIDLEETCYKGNEEFLYHVWLNLLDNAIKYSPPESKLTVSLRKVEGGLEIAICDEGLGLSPEESQHIFEKFYQADTSRKIKGNGLGLTLVKQIIHLHHGSINVSSQLGQGSHFIIYLPNPR